MGSHDRLARAGTEVGSPAGRQDVPGSAPLPGCIGPDRIAARAVARHPEQGWTLLYNGVVLFDDAGALLPDGRAVSPAPACTVVAAA